MNQTVQPLKEMLDCIAMQLYQVEQTTDAERIVAILLRLERKLDEQYKLLKKVEYAVNHGIDPQQFK